MGQTVRCIQPTASWLWQNTLAEVVQHRPKAGQVQVRLMGNTSESWMQEDDVALGRKGMSKPALAEKLNIKS